MNARLLIAALCAAALTPAARADKFHLVSKDDAEKMTAGEPDFIEGVLLEEKEGRYVIRVEGGQIEIAKDRVKEIEKTGLTVAQIEEREKEATDRLAAAEVLRRDMMAAAAEASAKDLRAARAEEAAARSEEVVVEEVATPPVVVYDPILHVAREVTAGDYSQDYYIRKELGGVIRRDLNNAVRRAGLRQ